ncbi:putative NBD/HSP70 family sugar kinase [Arthrobacter sp. SORGH_AS 212]|uniref:ROK family protein n=1 Tax=Pseudarthrobacter sp. SORGH_AS 212 TaxID=3041777 RepID=UPI00278A754A|nr:putative NBD/HSP70 family sugar kinase [Arthrobacter sp. SORGH_AS_0212]
MMEAFNGPLGSTSGPRAAPAIGVYLSGHEALGVISGPEELLPKGSLRTKALIVDKSVSGVVAATDTVVKGLVSRIPEGNRHDIEIGVALSGHLDPSTGRVVHSSDFRDRERSWFDVPLSTRVTEMTGLPTHLINDANALALDSHDNAGQGLSNFASVLVGEFGLGCGLVVNGNLVLGANGVSGEIGHIPVALGKAQLCRCGGSYCLERVVTRAAIEAKLADVFSADAPDPEAIGAAGLKIYEDAGHALGIALVVLMNLLNPSAIAIHAPVDLLEAPGFIEEARATAKRCSFSNVGTSCNIFTRRLDPIGIARGAAVYVQSLRQSVDA